jgi:hypothetical protein
MVAIRLQQFRGMIPAVDDKLLPENAAAYAINTWLLDGKATGMRDPTVVHTLVNPDARSVQRVPKVYSNPLSLADSFWLEFVSPHTTYVRSPNTQRTDPTGYWCDGLSPPMMTSRTRIEAGLPPLKMGIPSPTLAPVVTVATPGISAVITARSYVYTWVSSFGEEGAPSPPSPVVTHPNDTTYNLVLQTPTSTITDQRDLTKTRIYRTITSDQGVAEFFFVAEIPFTETTYLDTELDNVIVLNEQLKSQDWAEPPVDLQGIVSMPNGMVIGWKGQQIWFCEPYQLHAWPYKYMIGVDYPVVGIGVLGQTAVACTSSRPYAVTGTHPDQMAQAALALAEPCTSQGSVVSTDQGVYYSSPNGLVMVQPGGGGIVTAKLIVKDEWQSFLNIRTLRAAMLLGAYYCFSSAGDGAFEPTAFENSAFEMKDFSGTRNGAYIDPMGGATSFTILRHISPTHNVIPDQWTGEVMLIRDGKVMQVDLTENAPQGIYFWRSKLYQMQNRQNLSAVKCFYSLPQGVLEADQYLVFRAFADGKKVKERLLPASGRMFRMPTGYTADTYQFELEGNLRVENLQIATSPKELRQV